MKNEITRRQLLIGTAALGVAAALRIEASEPQSPKTIVVPEKLPDKLYTTARVGISKRTHDEHLKLWQGYARKTNEIRQALAALDKSPAKANQIYSQMRALKVDYTFAYQGYLNHELYFHTLGGSGSAPMGRLGALVRESFGSFDNWKTEWKSLGRAARGWAYLAYDRTEKRLQNYIGDAQNSFPLWNHDLVLAMDVYEHAYYLDFGTNRGAYIDAYLACVDWDEAAKRLSFTNF